MEQPSAPETSPTKIAWLRLGKFEESWGNKTETTPETCYSPYNPGTSHGGNDNSSI
jgi:hypothetical protein